MNERIQKIAQQTDIWCDQNYSGDEHYDLRWEEKFAELIVKECMTALKDMHLWQSVNNQNYPGAWHDAVDQSIDTLKEHFGIE